MKLNTNRNSTAALRLPDFLPYRLSVLANTISNTLARSYADRFGVSIPQWRVMAVLGDDPGRSANELVERTRMDKVSVSRAVSGLAADGRVLRRSDPTDRRRSLLRLSASGRSIYEKIVPLARTLHGAGWRPVTQVKATAAVRVERYGVEPMYLTLRNPSKRAVAYQLEIAGRASGKATELLDGAKLTWRGGRLRGRLGPGQVQLVRLARPE